MQLLPPAKRRFHYNPNSLSDLNVDEKAQEEFWGFVDASRAPYESEQAQRDERPYAKMSASADRKTPESHLKRPDILEGRAED